jgi:hypothetical protein
MSVYKEVREIITQMPNITVDEILELMPHSTKARVSSALWVGTTKGEFVRDDSRPARYTLAVGDFKPVSKLRKSKDKTVSNSALEDQINTLKSEIQELKAWKQDAIKRFPELSVAPVVFRARKIAAEQYKSDANMAQNIMSGNFDNKPLIAAIVAALEENWSE